VAVKALEKDLVKKGMGSLGEVTLLAKGNNIV
jgi:hypothetical protein